MTAPRQPGMDEPVEALVADWYLDALLAAHEEGVAPTIHHDRSPDSLDPSLAATARVLRRTLVRVHPSFRFEERLASRLADFASAQGGQAVAGGGGRLIPFPGPRGPRPVDDPLLPAILAGDLDPTDADALDGAPSPGVDRRPLLVGGALTSAALSIVGVAWVAWRASRPGARRAALDGVRLTGGTA